MSELNYLAFQDRENPEFWRVESRPNAAGEFEVAVFGGPKNEARASEYAMIKNGTHPVYNKVTPPVPARVPPPPMEALLNAVKDVYYAAFWTPDRVVDARRLWESLRDAAGFEPDSSPKEQRPTEPSPEPTVIFSNPGQLHIVDYRSGTAATIIPDEMNWTVDIRRKRCAAFVKSPMQITRGVKPSASVKGKK